MGALLHGPPSIDTGTEAGSAMFSSPPAVEPLLFVCLQAVSVPTPHSRAYGVPGVSGSVPLWQHRETAWVLCFPVLTWFVFFGNSDMQKKILLL